MHFLEDKHISGKDRAAHVLRCLCDLLEEAAFLDQLNLGALACLEVAARRLNLMVDADKQGDAPSYVNAKYLTPLAETDEILAPGLRIHMSRRARENWEVLQSAKKGDAAAEIMENRAEFPARDKGNEAEVPAGSVPRPLRNDAKPAWGGHPFGAGRQLDPVQRHFPSLLVNVTCSLFLVPQLPRM